jgi:serine phosphatase RsbU (regulator of sigma subunit)
MALRIPFPLRIAAATALLSLVALGLFAYLSFNLHSGMIIQGIQAEMTATVRNSAALFDPGDMDVKKPGVVEAVRNQLKKLDEVNVEATEFRLCALANEGLVLVGSSFPEDAAADRVGKPFQFSQELATAFAECTTKKMACATPIYLRGNAQWVSALAPVLDEKGQIVGVLSAGREAVEYRQAIDAAVKETAVYSIAALAVAVVLGIFVSAEITRPIRALYEASKAARDGRFKPIKVTGSDEVAMLTRDFNETNVALQGKIAELEALTRELEQRVVSRTEQLSKSYEDLRERQQVLQHEIGVARRVQETIIPKSLHRESIDIDVEYIPILEIGGDLGLVVERGPYSFGVAVGDVTGHGIGAALVVNRAHMLCSTLSGAGVPLESMFFRLDAFFAREIADIGIFMTMFVCRFDLAAMKMEYGGAGHPPALLYRPSADSITALPCRCGMLGVGNSLCDDPPILTIPIEKGDFVILYTDGLVEATDRQGEQFGPKRLEETVRAAAAGGSDGKKVAETIIQSTKSFTGGYFQDDVLVLAVQVK